MKFIKTTLLSAFLLFVLNAVSQENKATKASFVGKVTSVEHVPSIASRFELVSAIVEDKEMMDGRSSKNIIVAGKDPQTLNDFFVRNPNPLSQKLTASPPSVVFDAYTSSSTPTDPALAVGPNHVFVVFNTGFIIYDKSGNALTGQIAPNPTIFPNGGCCDLTASYDQAADRWVISFLGSGAQIAVSDGPDPINDGWYTYTISNINDYQKLSVWSDGYYLTDNGGSHKVWALERDKMLVGDEGAKVVGFDPPGIITSGFHSLQVFNVTDANMPATGGTPVVYMQDDAWAGVAADHIKLWTIDVDWTNTTNSAISVAQEIPTTPFISVFDGGGWSNLAQPGGGSSLDALQATIMNQAQFRKFADHNSAVFNFVVNINASGENLAGVRWMEFRQDADNQPWSLYQEGTYAAPDSKHAWCGSLIMDVQGNIGMGYSSISSSASTTEVKISSYYTGRFASDPLGTMTIAEELIATGDSNIPSTRYGDYSKIDIDPSDDKTFWYITEYMSSGRAGVVGAFKIAPDYANDIGAINLDSPITGVLTNSEPVKITIFNYGENDATGFDVFYQIDGGDLITETFTGTIASNTSAQYTFTNQADFSTEGHTYSVMIKTGLTGDEDTDNDSVTQEVTHLFHNDLGVIAITDPVSATGMSMESIGVTIQNFGGLEQTNFDVSYVLQGGSPVVETVVGPIAAGATLDYTFTTQGDFSNLQGYNLSAKTTLASDSDVTNNQTSVIVVNSACSSETNDTSQPIGPDSGTITNSIITMTNDDIIYDLNVTINLNHTYDGDLDIFLIAPDGTTKVELTSDNGGSGEDFIDTVFDDEATMSILDGTAPFTGTFKPEGNLADFNGFSSLGDWTLEITDDAGGDSGTFNSWSLEICTTTSLEVFENSIDANDLVVKTWNNNQFEISLTTNVYDENLTFKVFDLFGNQIVYHVIKKQNGSYIYPLDMSYMSSGVYIIRLGNNQMGKVKRILVK
jgi:subtilisin-like proprotein convertase family protein